MLEQYIQEIGSPVIVRYLISEAPLQKIKKYYTITIEKILVDLFCDEKLFAIYHGKEKRTIFQEAYAKYTINKSKLLRYATRRGKREALESYINQIIGNTKD